MSLADPEILELNALCNALADGTINSRQFSRLEQWLGQSEDARRYYVRALGLCASLQTYASEMQSEPADALPSAKIIRPFVWAWLIPLAAAAVVVLFVTFRPFLSPSPGNSTQQTKADESVARLTGSKECKWLEGSAPLPPNAHVNSGERIQLIKGFAEITFDSGAQVVLEGPASLEVNSAWNATLLSGKLRANVPPEATGFRVSNPAVEVVDLGTEFAMVADDTRTDVIVLKGKVEADPGASPDQPAIVLREKEGRRFASSGGADLPISEQLFEKLNQRVSLNHFSQATTYAHWSFDEAAGDLLVADTFGASLDTSSARLEGGSGPDLSAAHVGGRWGQHALRFDGSLFAKAALPGISENSPRTVLFWIRIPPDAQLSDAYAMVAWVAGNNQLGPHPVHISWNRNPNEGTLGVLRTDYGHGFALGETPLRDNQWHHVAVVFAPGKDDGAPVEIKQYVDGRFEGEGKPSPPGRSEDPAKFSDAATVKVRDRIWLGCRVGSSGPRMDRFRGEMDELIVANRALGPREIVELMKNNQPPRPVPDFAASERGRIGGSSAGSME